MEVCADGLEREAARGRFHLPSAACSLPVTTMQRNANRKDTVLGLAPEDLSVAAAAGSLHIDDEEIDAAFEFFDLDRTGKITAANLKDRLGACARLFSA